MRVRHFDQAGAAAAEAGARRQGDGQREAGGGGGVRRVAALVEDLLGDDGGLRFVRHGVAEDGGGGAGLAEADIAGVAVAEDFVADTAARQ